MHYLENETMRIIGNLEQGFIDDGIRNRISDIVKVYQKEPYSTGKNFLMAIDSFLLGYKYGKESKE